MNAPKLQLNKLSVEYRSIESLRENPDNAKLHPKEQVSKICRSIRRFGFLVPLLVDGDGMLLCGHGQLEAAKQLGEKTLPVVCIDHLTEAERRAFVIADNKLAEQGKWDEKQLAIEFNTLLELEDEIEIVDTGFEIGEIDCLIEKHREPSETDEEDFLEAEVERACQRGDLWQLGKHRLYCGDALDPKSYKILLGSKKAEMAFVDPPYNLPIAGVASGKGKVRHKDFVQASGEMSREQFREFLESFIQCSIASTKNGALHFICMDWRQIDLLVSVGRKHFDELKAICVWDKGTGSMGSLYRSRHEFITVFKSGSQPHINNIELGRHGRNRSNVWTYPGMGSFG
ncbi:MAG: ParB N-terminal domain-containing protein, partial [Pseudomonadota bacterium]